MDQLNDPQQSRRNRKARERRQKRRQRRKAVINFKDDLIDTVHILKPDDVPQPLSSGVSILRDIIWHVIYRTPVPKIAAAALVIGAVVLVLSFFTSNKIGPNIYAMGIPLGGRTPQAAEAELLRAWNNDILVDVTLEGQTFTRVRPNELGLSLDAAQMAQQAKDAGLSGIPFGQSVDLAVEVSYGTAQSYMLSIVDRVYIPPYEAGYEWQDGELVAMRGQPSRELDVTQSAQYIIDNPDTIIQQRQLPLATNSTPPAVIDSTPYLDEAYEFVNGDFMLIGYDPFRDAEERWGTTQAELAKWLAAGENGLILRADAFERMVDALNNRLREEDRPRYIDEDEAIQSVAAAIQAGDERVDLRVRYLPTTYTLESGDFGHVISRKTGLPFRHIDDANPGLEWEQLSIGQVINIPSRDLVLPKAPLRDKRIIVDLDRLWLVAYEDNEVVFSWKISSGSPQAPTLPGTYQILEKTEVAYGSSFALCSDSGCGQWEMNWFMGIYEVYPGLTNGFHGAVLLPNGAYLDNGSVGARSTYGCVMSEDPQAEELYRWADVGTVVEIVSERQGYEPQSSLAQQAMSYMDANAY